MEYITYGRDSDLNFSNLVISCDLDRRFAINEKKILGSLKVVMT